MCWMEKIDAPNTVWQHFFSLLVRCGGNKLVSEGTVWCGAKMCFLHPLYTYYHANCHYTRSTGFVQLLPWLTCHLLRYTFSIFFPRLLWSKAVLISANDSKWAFQRHFLSFAQFFFFDLGGLVDFTLVRMELRMKKKSICTGGWNEDGMNKVVRWLKLGWGGIA